MGFWIGVAVVVALVIVPGRVGQPDPPRQHGALAAEPRTRRRAGGAQRNGLDRDREHPERPRLRAGSDVSTAVSVLLAVAAQWSSSALAWWTSGRARGTAPSAAVRARETPKR